MSRAIWPLQHGIHPPENKRQSQKPIGLGPIPAKLVIPLQQHIGAAARPVVEVGQPVLKGQRIGAGSGFISLPVHASSSGTVVAIEKHPTQHPSQIEGHCIIIETDGKDTWTDLTPLPHYADLPPKQVLNAIREAGIAGLGGAGFPTAVKLGIHPENHIDFLLLNGAECEPYITADDMLMRERANDIIEGLAIIHWLVNPKTTLIGIEDNKPEAIAAMQAACANYPFEVVSIPTKYPSGGEKQLIHILTGREVHSGQLPADSGVLCQNVGTAYAVHRAIHHGEPLISRVTTLTGTAIDKPGNYDVRLGTRVCDLLTHSAAHTDNIHRLVMGGPMMGFSIHDATVPVVKVTNCLIAATEAEFPDPAPELPCIRCGQCAQVCPVSLLPQQLHWHAKAKELDKAAALNLFDCIECGACAYVCPSQIPLVQYYRFAKGQIRTQEEEARKADHARQRFEQRQARLEREAQEKEERRKARAEAAAAKAAAKKAAAETENALHTDQPDNPDKPKKPVDLALLETAVASTRKRWKDAEKALQAAADKSPDQLAALQTKVDQLKTKATAAEQRLADAKAQQQEA